MPQTLSNRYIYFLKLSLQVVSWLGKDLVTNDKI